MATLKDLAKRMSRLDTDIKNHVNEGTKTFARAAVASMIPNTAVLTSKALSNWRIAIGTQPPVGDIEPYSDGNRMQSGKAMQQIAYAAISMRLNGETIHLYNNADYIAFLDREHPEYNSMVRKAIGAGYNAMNSYYKKTKISSKL